MYDYVILLCIKCYICPFSTQNNKKTFGFFIYFPYFCNHIDYNNTHLQMKKIALSLVMAICCLAAKANNEKSLFVTFEDGQKVEFALASTPEVTFGNDQMTIKTAETTASYELASVSTFTYGSATTGISQVESNGKFALEGNRIIIDGTDNKISVFNLDGKKVSLSPVTTGNKTVINIGELTHGIYVININNKSIKIARQ